MFIGVFLEKVLICLKILENCLLNLFFVMNLMCGVVMILGCDSSGLFLLVSGLILNILSVVVCGCFWFKLVNNVFFLIKLVCEVFMKIVWGFIIVKLVVVIIFLVFGFSFIWIEIIFDCMKNFLWFLVISLLFVIVWVCFCFEFY